MKSLATYTRACIVALVLTCATSFGQIPIPDGFPNASNTGIAGAGLTTDDLTDIRTGSDIYIDTDGAVLEDAIVGKVIIQAANVTIRRCYFAGGNPWPLDNNALHAGLVVEDCTFAGNGTSVAIVGRYTARRCNISGYQDGVKISSDCVLEDSYIHDLVQGPDTHNDGIQKQYLKPLENASILHNSIIGPYQSQTSAIIIGNNDSTGETVRNLVVEDNFISGGGWSVSIRNNDGIGPQNVSLQYNVWEDGSWQFGPLLLDGSTHVVANNFDHNGVAMSFNQSSNAAATPTISPYGGQFSGSVQVTLACTTPGAQIRYTTDHSNVTASSPLYTGPFTITADTHVKARAFATGYDNSLLAFAAFDETSGGNIPPTADAGPDQTVTDSDSNGSEDVTLDGSGSSDSDGTITSYVWEENSSQIATGVSPTVSLTVGVHTIDLTIADNDAATGTDSAIITVNAAPGGGETYTIGCSSRDQVVHSDGSLKYLWQNTHRIGGGISGGDGAAILPFQLPTLAADETVADANVDVWLNYVANSPIGNVDLYGLGYRSAVTVLVSDFYQGVYDGDTTDACALQDDFAVLSTPAGAVSTDATGDANLAAYIAAQYAAGAQGGDWIFIRMNPDLPDVQDSHYWDFVSADGSDAPQLTIQTSMAGTKAGDADGDGDVDLDDFVSLKSNFGTTEGATQSEGDFDGNGNVDLDDFVILKTNFGT